MPNQQQITQLDTLLQRSPVGGRGSNFDRYRKGPVSISGPAFNAAILRYKELSDFGIQKLNFSHIPLARLKGLARYASSASAYKIGRMPREKRIAVLMSFVKAYETDSLDDALDVLDLLITDIVNEAKKMGKKNRLRTMKDLDRSALILASVCSRFLRDETTEPGILKEDIFAICPKQILQKSINTINELARPGDDQFYDEMVKQYGRVRRFLPQVFKYIKLKGAPAGTDTIEAVDYLISLQNSRKQVLVDPPLGIVSPGWKRLVFDKDGQVTKRGYTLCFLAKLQDCLRRRDVFVADSLRWGDTRAKLLQDDDWRVQKVQVCRSLSLPTSAEKVIANLSQQLDESYQKAISNFGQNESVRIDDSGKKPSLTITQLDKIDEPESLIKLREQVTELLPKIELTELLLEINAHTGFADEFFHVSEANARAENLLVSICAVLLAEACNIGLEPLVRGNVPALTLHRLSWVKQNYVRAETLSRANARLVDYQATLQLPQIWGGGEVASADGLRFVTPVRTINSGPNRKYFGANRGITWYNFVSDQYSGFHGIVIPGTLRDSIFVLEGLLEQQTSLKPTEIMTDTAGSSDLVFGLFWLLGYQFSPRLSDAGESVFWRIDKEADYGVLNEVSRGQIRTEQIEQHWEDMLRIAGSLKLGTVQASELIRSLLKSDRPSSLAKAIIELGRINKTIYLLNYIDNEDYRRRILNQLNRGEARHTVARAICYGNRGEIRKRYREGQEDQLGALGLVTNAIILWNTIYIEAALNHIRNHGGIVLDTDIARIAPLPIGHINILGQYSFTLSEKVTRGELRPLNDEE